MEARIGNAEEMDSAGTEIMCFTGCATSRATSLFLSTNLSYFTCTAYTNYTYAFIRKRRTHTHSLLISYILKTYFPSLHLQNSAIKTLPGSPSRWPALRTKNPILTSLHVPYTTTVLSRALYDVAVVTTVTALYVKWSVSSTHEIRYVLL